MKLTRIADLDARLAGGTDGDGGGEGPVVILLHGFGAPGDDLVPLWRALGAPPGTRFVFPEAPVKLGPEYGGGRAWWWIDLNERILRRARGAALDVNEVPEGLVGARAKVAAFATEAIATLRPPPGKVVLGGFSQGAMLALDVALHATDTLARLAGVVVLSGTHIAAQEWAARYDARRGLPVFMSHGQTDELLPFAVAEGLRDTLRAHGIPVEWIAFRGGHGIPPNVVDGVSAFLRTVLA
jgi:phospholipase/carboxylesterase